MGLYLRLTEIAFVGRSLTSEGGQNPLEPAMLDTAVLAGRNVQNFRETYQRLIDSGGAKLVRDRDMLAGAVNFLLTNEVARHEMMAAGAATVEEMRGALARTLKSLEPYIQPLVVKSRLQGRQRAVRDGQRSAPVLVGGTGLAGAGAVAAVGGLCARCRPPHALSARAKRSRRRCFASATSPSAAPARRRWRSRWPGRPGACSSIQVSCRAAMAAPFARPHVVDPHHDAARHVGDEPLLLAEHAPVAVTPNRAAGARLLLEKQAAIS